MAFRCIIKAMMFVPAEDLQYYIDHIFLPPKLPQEAEDCGHARSAEQGLLRLLLHELTTSFQRPQTSTECSIDAWNTIERMLKCWTVFDSTPSITKSALLTALADIRQIGRPHPTLKTSKFIILIIRAQQV